MTGGSESKSVLEEEAQVEGKNVSTHITRKKKIIILKIIVTIVGNHCGYDDIKSSQYDNISVRSPWYNIHCDT